jgi:hypothetical protein
MCEMAQKLVNTLLLSFQDLKLMLRTATHTRLRIAFEAKKLEVVTLEVVLILEEQVQLVLTRVRDNVPRLSIYTIRTLLRNFKVGKSAPPPSREKFAPSLLLSRP